MIPSLAPQINCQDPWQEDVLCRKPLAERLTQMITAAKRPLVVGVSAPWGTGKTVFLRKLTCSLRNSEYEAMYFNAWESDFVTDPLMAVVSEFDAYFTLRIKEGKGKFERHVESGLDKLAKVTGALGPLFAKVASGGTMDVQEIREAGEGVREALDRADIDWRNVKEILGGAIVEPVREYVVRKHAASVFQNNLMYFVRMIGGASGNKPVVMVIDELDRCRPSYAIELLEAIKHLFNVPGMCFLIGLDIDQLSHSVRSLYGEGFAARHYLSRFIDIEYRLPEPDSLAFVRASLSTALECDVSTLERVEKHKEPVTVWMVEMARFFNLSLRDLVRLVGYLTVVRWQLPALPVDDLGYVVFAIAWRYSEPLEYERFERIDRERPNTYKQLKAKLTAERVDGAVAHTIRLRLGRSYLQGKELKEYEERLRGDAVNITSPGGWTAEQDAALERIQDAIRTLKLDLHAEIVAAVNLAVPLTDEESV